MQEYTKGTPDYKALEEEITRRRADLQVKASLRKNEFLQNEASIYFTVYQEILQATDYYCQQNGIDLVVRFSSEQVKPQQPESILAFINKDVVWYQKQLDITPMISQDLNRSAVNPEPLGRCTQRAGPSGDHSLRRPTAEQSAAEQSAAQLSAARRTARQSDAMTAACEFPRSGSGMTGPRARMSFSQTYAGNG